VNQIQAHFKTWSQEHESAVKQILIPGFPERLQLVPPRALKRRGMATQDARNRLLHAIAQIEFNAINLALDAAYRFRHQPAPYYEDWIGVASDEARHFQLIRDYLNLNGCDYGDYPVHNGLWEMAVETEHDVLARMALVPRVLEARGLDVTPTMIKKLEAVGDTQAVEILNTIYEDEIGHVATGSRWFKHHCQQRELEPGATFKDLIARHLHGQMRGPYNKPARRLAGFAEQELTDLEAN
jgi:uncharacterized ferritin-like protein (DUF455 family)